MNPGKLVTASLLVLSATVFPATSVNAKVLGKTSANNGLIMADSARGVVLMKRLEAIKAMDFASMAPPEKRKLRKEVRSITKEVREIHGRGVYISAAGIIIIILLLILLL